MDIGEFFVNVLKPLDSRWESVPGQTAAPELTFLQWLISVSPEDATFVELGVCQGRSLCAMAAVCRGSQKVYGVDDFDPANPGYITPSLEATEGNIRRFGFQDRVVLIAEDSTRAGRVWGGPKITIWFHDASHLRGKVAEDIRAWLPHMGENSYMLFHDYTGTDETQIGISQAADALLATRPCMVIPRLGVFEINRVRT